MKINKKILEFCSKNLLIDFTEEEKKFLYEELEGIVDSLEKVKNMDLENINPTDYPITTKNNLKEDDDIDNNAVEYVKKIKNYKSGYVKVNND